MKDFTVQQYGVDSSGRPVYMTVYMKSVLDDILADPRVAPFADKIVVIQGAFMERLPGGGAKESAGYHNKAGCIDCRTRTLTRGEIDIFIRVAREHGFAFWRRDKTPKRGGMDPHMHGTLGADYPPSDGARISWHSYVTGGDGLAGPGRDYEWRPVPLVLEPPEEDMALSDADVQKVVQGLLKTKIKTADAPEGRYIDSILQKVYDQTIGKA